MTTEVLICTTLPRLHKALQVPLPPMPGISYLISVQGGVPDYTPGRADIRIVWMTEMGLSRNRNLALSEARGDVLVIADDDNEPVQETLKSVAGIFEEHPDWDIIQLRGEGSGKPFPAPYVSSWELVLRRATAGKLRFDERFGLGSRHLACGEEEVFCHAAQRRGLHIRQVNRFLCRVNGPTTGDRFLSDPRVQRSKGAVFALTRGCLWAYYKCTREAIGRFVRKGANPFPLLKNMFWGIRYIEGTCQNILSKD